MIKRNKKERFIYEHTDKNLEFVNSKFNIKTNQHQWRTWFIPLLIILLLLFLLVFFLPKYIRGKRENLEKKPQQIIQDEFLQKANAVVESKYARVYDVPDLLGTPKTSILFNEPLQLITEKEENGFYAVRTYDGIEGYVQADKLTFDVSSIQANTIIERAVVINGDKSIASDTSNGNIVAVAPMGSVLYADYVTQQILRVVLPRNQIGWLSRENVLVFSLNEKIPTVKEKQADIFASGALKFLNVAYMPAGLSLEGIDMPGVIYLASLTNGLEMSRLIDEQVKAGHQISFERDAEGFPYAEGFKVGDLLFFSNSLSGNVESVGIFLGEDNVLYAYGNQSKIEIISLNDNEKLFKSLQVVRRLFE